MYGGLFRRASASSDSSDTSCGDRLFVLIVGSSSAFCALIDLPDLPGPPAARHAPLACAGDGRGDLFSAAGPERAPVGGRWGVTSAAESLSGFGLIFMMISSPTLAV